MIKTLKLNVDFIKKPENGNLFFENLPFPQCPALANLTATCVGTQYSQAPPPSNAAPPPTLSNPKASIVSSGPYASIEALGLDKVGVVGVVGGGAVVDGASVLTET